MKIDGLDFTIKKVDIQNNTYTINSGFGKYVRSPGNQSIILYAETYNKIDLDKWYNGIFNNGISGYARTYKKDIVFNTVQIYGMYPQDYEFTSTGTLVTFSADYIKGDLELFKIKHLRKEKLKKLNSL